MKFSHAFLSAFILLTQCHARSIGEETRVGGEIVGAVPICALSCMSTQITEYCGSLSNTTCICSSQELVATLTPCVAAVCNITESLSLLRYQAVLCDVPNVQNRVHQQSNTVYAVIPLAVLFFLIRIYTRIKLDSGLGADDWMMFLALLPLLASAAFIIKLVLNSFGSHTYFLSTWQVSDSLKYFWLGELSYLVTLTFTKLSLLWFFRRIFPVHEFRTSTLIVAVFVVTSNISLFIAVTFQCLPFEGNWMHWLFKVNPYQCINTFVAVYTAAGLSIIHDLIIMCLPLPILWSLRLPWQKKANLFVMFCFGFFVVICSLFRLPTLMKLQRSSDPSYDQAPIVVWTELEMSIGIICGCLPACRALLGHLIPGLRMKLSSTNAANEDSTPASNTKQHGQRYSTGATKPPRSGSSRSFIQLTEIPSEMEGEVADEDEEDDEVPHHGPCTASNDKKDKTGDTLENGKGLVPDSERLVNEFGCRTLVHVPERRGGAGSQGVFGAFKGEGIVVKTTVFQSHTSSSSPSSSAHMN